MSRRNKDIPITAPSPSVSGSTPSSEEEDDSDGYELDHEQSRSNDGTMMAVDHVPGATGSSNGGGNGPGAKRGSTKGIKRKEKLTRVSRACLLCRKAKMKCTGGLEPPCDRCKRQGTECHFIESRRGKATKTSRLAKAIAAELINRGIEPTSVALPDNDTLQSLINADQSPPTTSSSTVGMLLNTANEDIILHAHGADELSSTSSFPTSLTMPALPPPTTSLFSLPIPMSLPGHTEPLGSALSLAATTLSNLAAPLPPNGELAGTQSKSPPIASIPPFTSPKQPPHSSLLEPQLSIPDRRKSASTSNHLFLPGQPAPLPHPPPIVLPRSQSVSSASPSSNNLSSNSPAAVAHPFGVLAEAAASSSAIPYSRPPSEHGGDVEELGIASSNYFNRESRETDGAEGVLSVLTDDDVVELFRIFFDHVHVHIPILDREHSSPAEILQRSPVLFNAICCVTAKYYTDKPELLPDMEKLAQIELDKFPKSKSLEIVQAQICFMMWGPLPISSFDTDMTWMRTGLAIRMAMELNLHKAEKVYGNSLPKWRIRSMHRTWLCAMMMEKTTAVQLNKPSILWNQDPTHGLLDPAELSLEDTRLLTTSEWTELIARGLDSIQLTKSMGSKDGDQEVADVHALFQRQLEAWREIGEERERRWESVVSEESSKLQRARFRIYFGYAQLVLSSVGMQHTVEVESSQAVFALAKYQAAALSILHAFRDDFAPTKFSHYLNDYQYSYVLYAAVSLLRSIQPQFRHSLVDKVVLGKLIFTTASLLEDAARSWNHLPFLQAKFLRRVLKARIPEFKAPPRGPLPPRLVPPPRPKTQDNNTGGTSSGGEELNPFALDQDSFWSNTDFTDTTFGRSQTGNLFNWEDFLALTPHPPIL
ncbi:hypothetical protein T439DRAFT_329987 [Meredithblackwellia eburnea MCA 4105]